MRILFTNHSLDGRTGTELYVLEVTRALRERGHEPCCYTRRAGALARELERSGVPVTTDLALVERPALVHGHHLVETSLAAMAFPEVPVVAFCHGPKAWQETPAPAPNVVRHVAVDDACRRRLVETHGVPEADVRVLLNYVDTARFAARQEPLPDRPGRALLFSNYATPDAAYVKVIREVCGDAGIELDLAGAGAGAIADRPEEVLAGYDIVFAKARCALEAMAVGCAVVQCEYFGAGRMVTPENFDELRRLNFGYATMTFPVEAGHLSSQIAAYDPAAAAAVSRRVRAEAGLDSYLDHLEALHAECAAMRPPPSGPADHLAALERILGAGSAAVVAGWDAGELSRARRRLEKLEADLARFRDQRAKDRARLERLRAELDRAKGAAAPARRERSGIVARLFGFGRR